MRLIPAIDLRGGRCVRLLRGDFDAETRYAADAFELLERYSAVGADWLHVVDLDGAKDGSGANRELITALARRGRIRLQAGGGLRSTAAVAEMLNAGVERVVVGSLAVTAAPQVRGWLDEFGVARVVLAFDVRVDAAGIPRCAIHGWREQSVLSLWDAIEQFADRGLKHVLCTDVSRDGALGGPNIGLYAEAAQRFAEIEWQASGGIRDAHDLHELARVGAAAAISGKALLEELIPPEELRPFLPNASFPA
jgi:phosphoribosylformimino-5-aminoimidazole carboxamide ribotide isomerase